MATTSKESMATASKEKRLVAVTQMCSTSDREANLATCMSLIEKASDRGAEMVFLPEAFDYIGENREQTVGWAQQLDGPLITTFQHYARKYNVWLSLGGMHEAGGTKKIRNTHVILNNMGLIAGTYSKIHLFDVDLPEKQVRLMESDYTIPGNSISAPVETPVGNVAMSICYDLRFAQLSQCQREMGAEILTYPSAFTQATGMAHWEPILRARAVETQCYVIAAAQSGKHNSKRTSYGHAMIVDPWGTVIAQCGEETDVAIAGISLPYLQSIREQMPLMSQRRPDVYTPMGQLVLGPDAVSHPLPDDEELLTFGHVKIKGKMVFACTSLSIATVNIKCVVPGHVLVLPRRKLHRFNDLKPDERNDLAQLVGKVQKVIEKFYESTASNISIQDGPEAGQTVEHLHVHVLPRRTKDFSYNDQVYEYLEKTIKISGELRSEEEMAEESRELRRCFLKTKF